MFGTISTYPNNVRVQKSLIAAKYNQLKVNEKIIKIGSDNKTPEFLKKFPLGKVPAFEGSDGFTIFESGAIAYYIANQEGTQLLGKNRKEQALVHQWIAFADNELNPATAAWLYPIYGYYPANDAVVAKAKEDVKKSLTALNSALELKTFLVGERVTLADISLVCALSGFFQHLFEPAYIKPFGNVLRWFQTCVNQPHFKDVMGEIQLCQKMKMPGDLAKPKEQPAAAEETESAEEKKKNPLDLLPKSSFILDEWKRFYSNNDTRPTAVDWFWSKFDKEGYSIYRVNYKYNSELTQVFMTSNLVGGFFQRLERARKYAFGSMCILGENKNNEIYGYFVIRGQEVPFEFTDTADYPSYTFTKVNTDDKNVREDINAVFAWDDQINGKKFADGKIFK